MNKGVKSLDRQTGLVFDKRQTNLIKGIAILFMVLHHTVGLYYNQVDLQWYGQNTGNGLMLLLLFLSTAGKVCVQLLTILSGFGLAKSYSKYLKEHNGFIFDFKFILSHLIQFYSVYWPMFVLNTIIRCSTIITFGEYFGANKKGVLNFFISFFGLSNLFGTKGFGNWFVSAIIILYILFPFLYRLVDKLSIVPIIISIVPWILRPYVNSVGISTDSVLFCLLAFTTGIIFAQKDVLDKVVSLNKMKYKLLSIAIVIFTFFLRLAFSVYADYFFALSLIAFGSIVVSNIKYISSFFGLFGKNSANIWLSHGMIIAVFSYYISFPNSMMRVIQLSIKYVIVLSVSLLFSLVLEYIKKKAKYLTLVKKIRIFVEQ